MGVSMKSNDGVIARIVASMIISTAAGLALLMLMAALIVSGKVEETWSDKLLPTVWLLSGISGGFFAKKGSKENRMWVTAAATGGYVGVLLICSMLLFEGALYRPWLPVLCIAAGEVLPPMLHIKRSQKKKRYIPTR